MTELHTVERWRKHARQVKLGEQPIKRVKGLYNEAEKVAELYGFWQTIPYKNELTQDGKIPMVRTFRNCEIIFICRTNTGTLRSLTGLYPKTQSMWIFLKPNCYAGNLALSMCQQSWVSKNVQLVVRVIHAYRELLLSPNTTKISLTHTKR